MIDLKEIIQAAVMQPDLYKDDFLKAINDNEIIVPLAQKLARGTGETLDDIQDRVNLHLITLENDSLAVPIFSSQESFKNYLEFNEGNAYIHQQGHEVFKMACAESLTVVLDPMGPHAYQFSEEEVDALSEEEEDRGRDPLESFDQFKITEPKSLPQGVEEDLKKLLASEPLIKEAYLVELSMGKEKPTLCLGLYSDQKDVDEEKIAQTFQIQLNGYGLNLIVFEDLRMLKSFSDANTAFYFGW